METQGNYFKTDKANCPDEMHSLENKQRRLESQETKQERLDFSSAKVLCLLMLSPLYILSLLEVVPSF